MTCEARHGADNEWHCLRCRLRWSNDDTPPPGCAAKPHGAVVAELRAQAEAAADDNEISQAAKIATLLRVTLSINRCANRIAESPSTTALGIALFTQEFIRHTGPKHDERARLENMIAQIRAAWD